MQRKGERETEREKGARHAMGTEGNQRTNNYSSLSFSLSLPMYLSLLLWLTQHRGIRQPVYALSQRLTGIKTQDSYMMTISNMCTGTGNTLP